MKSPAQAPGARPVAAAHLQHVAEPRRGDEADPRALALEQRVGADRGAVNDGAEIGDAAERLEPGEKARRLVAALRRHLGGPESPGRAVEQEEVGEGAADIDADRSPAASSARAPTHNRSACGRFAFAHIAEPHVARDLVRDRARAAPVAAAAGRLQPDALALGDLHVDDLGGQRRRAPSRSACRRRSG